MPKANTTFNLDIRDVELIENALNSIITRQSSTIINSADNRNAKPQDDCPVEAKSQIAELRDLLGVYITKKFGTDRKMQLPTSVDDFNYYR